MVTLPIAKGGYMQVQKIISKYPQKQEYLIEMLLDVDAEKSNHFITEDELRIIANYVKVKTSHVCSVMSFYTLLSSEPRGKYVIQVCKDVPCYLNDDFNAIQVIEEALHIEIGQVTSDGLFSLEHTACIGCCDEAPAMRINHEIYTALTKEKVLNILESLRGKNNDRT